jgi:flagellar M-ring protein FliF
VRVIKETQASQNASNQTPASVDRNIPQDRSRGGDGRQSSEENQKREELTNYEVSSKRVSVVSGGYAIENISIAVLVNKASLLAQGAKPEELEQRLSEIEQLVSSAAGLRKERGDVIKVSAVDFLDSDHDLEPVPPVTFMELFERHSGTLIKSLAAVLICVLVVWFGLRPAVRALAEGGAGAASAAETPLLPLGEASFPGLESPIGGGLDFQMPAMMGADSQEGWPDQSMLDDLASRNARSPQRRLEQLVQFNEDQAVAVMRAWMREGKPA